MKRITVRQGDDLEFFFSPVFKVNADATLENWKCYYKIGNLDKVEVADITSKKVKITLTSEQTAKLGTGVYPVYLKFITANGLKGTVQQQLQIKIVRNIIEV